MAARLVLALISLVAIGWIAVGYRAVQHSDNAARLARTPPEQRTNAVVEEALDELRAARRFNPDPRPLADEGLLLASAGRTEEGIERLERAVRDEPENALLWGLLAHVTAETDPERSRHARARARELNPLGSRR